MNNIEKYLTNTPKRQKYLIYFMTFGLMIYIFVQMMMPILDEKTNLQNSIDNLQVKLAKNSLNTLKQQIIIKNKELLVLTSEQEKQKEKIDYLISDLYKLKYAFYNDKEWAQSIKDILQNSMQRNLKINYIKSIDVKDENSKNILKKKRSLEISGSGNYIDIAAFISYIDNLNTLLQFTKTNISLKGKELHFTLYIDMYGIGL